MIRKIFSALNNLVMRQLGYQQDLKANNIHSAVFNSLNKKAAGLHELLLKEPRIFPIKFSILTVIDSDVQEKHLSTFLESISSLSGNYEVILGIHDHATISIQACLERYLKRFPLMKTVKITLEGSEELNTLAEASTGNFLIILQSSGWVRPDLLYCYQLTLQANFKNIENAILYADEFEINGQGKFVKDSFFRKPSHCKFPFLSANFLGHPLGVSKKLWKVLGGFQSDDLFTAEFDFILRADIHGATFTHVPVFLYAGRRDAPKSIAPTRSNLENINTQKALQRYFQSKNLPIQVELNTDAPSIKLKVSQTALPKVQVVIPFRNNFEMTTRSIQFLMGQRGVEVQITLIDNRSEKSIDLTPFTANEIELIRNDESFNYSRLNNLVLTKSRFWGKAEYVLFLNNDVDLIDPLTVLEMTSWASIQNVGAVGIKLNYPTGAVQHGGIFIDYDSRSRSGNWAHYGNQVEGYAEFLHSADAVTAACLLMRQSLFQELGGFDEIFYPIAYSDTDLCLRIRKKELHIIYTPYVKAIHHESASRGSTMIEDFEESAWLMEYLGRQIP